MTDKTQWQAPIEQKAAAPVPTMNPSELDAKEVPTDPSMYYRARADHPSMPGWILMKQAAPQNRARFVQYGWTPLDEFGTFIHAQKSKDANGVKFNSTNHGNWRVLFQRGGASMFPVDQIVAYGWHLRPPFKEAVFPQMADVEVPEFLCPQCSKSYPDATYLKTHLVSRHDYTRMEIVAYAKDSGITFERHGARPAPEPVPKVLDMTTPPAERLSCDQCGFVTKEDSKRPKQSLSTHQRMSHNELPVQVPVEELAGVS